MVCDQKRLTQDCLTIAMRYLRVKIGRRILNECFHLLQILTKLIDGLLPQCRCSRLVWLRPITLWKLRRNVARIATELEYVRLRKAHVFQHLPRRVRQTLNLTITEIRRKAVYEIVE